MLLLVTYMYVYAVAAFVWLISSLVTYRDKRCCHEIHIGMLLNNIC